MNKIEIQVSSSDLQDIKKFCELNNIEFETLIKKSFKTGYNIEKYGLLGKTNGVEEKFIEVPVEVIKEVEKIIEVPIEIIKEIPVEKIIVQEVPIEKVVTKIEYICDNSQVDELVKKIETLESDKKTFSTKIEELEQENKKFSTIIKEKENIFQNNDKTQQLQTTIQTLMGKIRERDKEINELKEELKNNKTNDEVKPAVYLRSSNLGDNLYKE